MSEHEKAPEVPDEPRAKPPAVKGPTKGPAKGTKHHAPPLRFLRCQRCAVVMSSQQAAKHGRSKLCGGNVFEVVLPVGRGEAEEVAPPRAAEEPTEGNRAWWTKRLKGALDWL